MANGELRVAREGCWKQTRRFCVRHRWRLFSAAVLLVVIMLLAAFHEEVSEMWETYSGWLEANVGVPKCPAVLHAYIPVIHAGRWVMNFFAEICPPDVCATAALDWGLPTFPCCVPLCPLNFACNLAIPQKVKGAFSFIIVTAVLTVICFPVLSLPTSCLIRHW